MAPPKDTKKADDKKPKKAEAKKPAKAETKKPVKAEEEKKAKKRRQLVVTHPDGWQVKPEGASKATKVFKTKAEAEAYAKELAKKQGVGVMRKKKDGKIQKKG